MIRNYMTIAFRNLLKDKFFSLISILGLAVGIASSFMIYEYVAFETSYDDFHKHATQTYRANLITTKEGSEVSRDARTPPAVGSALLNDFVEVELFSRTAILGEAILSNNQKNIAEENVLLVDPEHFELFDYNILKGVPKIDLQDPLTVFISSNLAEKLFDKDDPVNESISINSSNLDGSQDFIIKGVFDPQRINAHLRPEILVSYATLHHFIGKKIDDSWDWNNLYTYVKLSKNVDVNTLQKKVKNVIANHNPNNLQMAGWQLDLQPMTDIHTNKFYSGEYVQEGIDGDLLKYFLLVGAFILLIAYVNFINLYTSKAAKRAKEIGVRKVSGASFFQLVIQLMTEVFFINLFGVLLAMTLIQISYPFLINHLGLWGNSLDMYSFSLWTELIVILFFGSVLSGIYPAFIMASWHPSKALKNAKHMEVGGMQLRKSLVVFQFAISSFLICGTITVFQQLDLMKNYDLGFNISQKVIVKSPQLVEGSNGTRASLFKNELKDISGVKKSAALNEIPGNEIYWKSNLKNEDATTSENTTFTWLGIDTEYFDLFEIDIIAGRSFAQRIDSFRTSAILNRKAAELFGFVKPEDAVGQKITLEDVQVEVVGISENFNQESLKKNIEPIVFRYSNFDLNYFAIHVESNDLRESIDQIQSKFTQLFPDSPFEYFFLDEYFDRQYRGEVLFGKIFTGITLMALFISCLGILGLSYQTIVQKTKEIGIRKVLGASLNELLVYLSKDYIKLIVIAYSMSIPVAYIVFSDWLNDFVTKVDIGGLFFITPFFILVIAIISVITHQTLKIAMKNPIDSLKYE